MDSSQTFYRYLPVATRDRDWGLFVTTVGESVIAPRTTYPPAPHPAGYHFHAPEGRLLHEYQIIYISAGHGWFASEHSRRTRIESGSVILLFPEVWHTYSPSPETGWHEHWVGFNGDYAKRLASRGFFSRERPTITVGAEDKVLALFNEIVEGTRGNVPALQQTLAGITVRMLALLYSVQQSRLAGDDPALQVIHRAMNLMREHPEKLIHMPDLARELKMSYRSFRRAFVHYTGLSPHLFLQQIRLARARDLLAQTGGSMKEIALQVGFEDAQYFSRLFHKKVGLPPGTWRARAHQRRASQ
jgi:AraC-like DNA-binding protein